MSEYKQQDTTHIFKTVYISLLITKKVSDNIKTALFIFKYLSANMGQALKVKNHKNGQGKCNRIWKDNVSFRYN